MSFFSELKRRNVIRVGILYGVGAWLLMQFTDVLSSLLPVPEWTGSLVVLLLAIGFLPVMVFAWAYELTPEGIKRDKDVDRDHSITSATGRRINTLIIVLLVLAIGVVLIDRLIPERAAEVAATVAVADSVAEPPGPTDASIAVLPFADLSPLKDQQYFTDGISEELLNVLVRVDGLRVASRTSSFTYRDSQLNVPALGQELNVGYVLEGSVRKDGYRIRITAQLIEAATDKHLWSENFDRELKDIFTIQDEIANSIVDALVGKLGVAKASKLVNIVPATENLDAYELYLKGRDLFQRRDQLPLSIALFEQAIALDPGFARAWEGLAAVQVVSSDWNASDGINHDDLAVIAADKAIALDPTLSLPYAVLGLIVSGFDREGFDRNYVKGMALFDQAISNDPKNTSAYLWRGLRYKDAGFFQDAIGDLTKCLEIDPGYLNCRQHLALSYLLNGDEDTALKLFEETLEANFHSIDEAFVPLYVARGQRMVALLVATIRSVPNSQMPVVEWIDALEDPDGNHQGRLARFDQWSKESGISIANASQVFISMKAYDRVSDSTSKTDTFMWTSAAADYRQSENFKQLMKNRGIPGYWKQRGFPPQCRPMGKDDFHCD